MNIMLEKQGFPDVPESRYLLTQEKLQWIISKMKESKYPQERQVGKDLADWLYKDPNGCV